MRDVTREEIGSDNVDDDNDNGQESLCFPSDLSLTTEIKYKRVERQRTERQRNGVRKWVVGQVFYFSPAKKIDVIFGGSKCNVTHFPFLFLLFPFPFSFLMSEKDCCS